jgi:hypothetical protein
MKYELKENYNFDFNFNPNTENNMIKEKNLYLHISPAPLDTYVKMLTTSNVALCISSQEGYGHYINEARYFETFVVVLDAPPMNELVENNKNGLVIKDPILSEKKTMAKYSSFKLYKAYPQMDFLRDSIIYCIKNKDKLHEMGKSGKKMYFKDKKYFIKKMKKIIKKRFLKKIK